MNPINTTGDRSDYQDMHRLEGELGNDTLIGGTGSDR
jgi:hypothetical protein